jgi:hypothetical protein
VHFVQGDPFGAAKHLNHLVATSHAHIVVRQSDTTTGRRMRHAQTVRFRARDEPMDTVPIVILRTRASSRQLRRAWAAIRSVAGAVSPYVARVMSQWTLFRA